MMPGESFYCLHSELCKTLANPKRQMILGSLRGEELTVGELQQRTGIPQATLSQHLSILRRHGVVSARRVGSHAYYGIANPKIIQAFDLITEVMQESLDAQAQTVTDAASSARLRAAG